MSERIEKSPHEFWKRTCGINTYAHGKELARKYTPWNGFTADDTTLVSTLWEDQIVSVFDPVAGKERRFIRLGGTRTSWKSLGKYHGKEAQANYARAFELKRSYLGYEAEVDEASFAKGQRAVKHFYLDRAWKLERHGGGRDLDLIQRLNLDAEFRKTPKGDVNDYQQPYMLFELLERVEKAPYDDLGEGTLEAEGEVPSITEQHAGLALPVLVEHVLKQRDGVMNRLTYEEVAARIGRLNKHGKPAALGMGGVLGKVTERLDRLKNPWPEAIPYLTTVVVDGTGPNKGLPGVGIAGKWKGYDSLTRSEKESMVMGEYDRILDFGSRWLDVLALLGVEDPVGPELPPVGGRGGRYGGGESPQHKALKLYVLANPHLVGASADSVGQDEADLLSGDVIDVLFKSETQWVGVEVKSRISDKNELDYRRGIFQVVKYQAVLEAQAKYERPNDDVDVKVYLVLETDMPRVFLELVAEHGVNLKSRVVPPEVTIGAVVVTA
ncbi:hypothetical protein QFZ42_004445 [Variovorax paradoxus]|uniref:hypothetical protein n=1 Tax=Variovorax paradoxus TaxID=34073 RepID=UPI002790E443|nr:hypothetical protein [Variovorax paradoxus]MDQ0572611.1 hypothetical protein [Variovorax paradoxus]